MGNGTDRPLRRVDPLLQVAGYALGPVAGGLAVNILSGNYRWRAVGVALLVAAVTAVGWYLRTRVHPQSVVGRWAPAVLLALALPAATGSLVEAWSLPATLLAVGLVATAVIVPTHLDTALRFLGGAAYIGLGVAFTGYGAAMLSDRNVLTGLPVIATGVAVIAVGMGFIGVGVAVLTGHKILAGVALIDLGVALVAAVVALLTRGNVPAGVALPTRGNVPAGVATVALEVAIIGIGVGLIGVGVAVLIDRKVLAVVAVAGGGVAATGGGVAELFRGEVLPGVTFIGLGVVIIGGVVAMLTKRDVPGVVVVCIGGGVVSMGGGVAMLAGGYVLVGAASIALGVAIIGAGVGLLWAIGALQRGRSRVKALTQKPTRVPPPRRRKRHPGATRRRTG